MMQSNMMQSNDDFNVDTCHFSFLLFCGTGVLWSQGSIRMGCDKTSTFHFQLSPPTPAPHHHHDNVFRSKRTFVLLCEIRAQNSAEFFY